MSLFEREAEAQAAARPLADRLRPSRLEDVLGQPALFDADGPIAAMQKRGRLSSCILWGPPGTGKTTIARLLAQAFGRHFEQVSAVFSGVADLRKVFAAAEKRRADGVETVLFVDEIHRFNRAQQDGFLPVVEDGTVILIGATTENPSFELNAALLSRCQVLVLERLNNSALAQLLRRAEGLEGRPLPLTPASEQALIGMADGDGRFLLNMAEMVLNADPDEPLSAEALSRLLRKRLPLYDKNRDGHYNLISALHKSLRGSDVDAALYWLARMLTAGEEPLYILRRLIRFAVEDIGMADPAALPQTVAAKDAFHFIGSPEGELAIAQAVIYLATAPKSNAAYKAFSAAHKAAKQTGSLMPPKHILNAPTALMKDLGYAEGYAYDHDSKAGFSGQNYFPETMQRAQYYHPVARGFEREVQKRLAYWTKLRAGGT